MLPTKEKFNWKSLFLAALLVIIGIILLAINVSWKEQAVSVGCSLIASAIVIAAHDFLIEKKLVSELDEWCIDKIYSTRAEKNADSDPELEHAKHQLDAVAFGLSNFRSKNTKRIEACLKRGVNVRILTMNPQSEFVRHREREENAAEGHIKKSINDLVLWANRLNSQNTKGAIVVKGYNCMSLDFYWRVDNKVFIGPYWYGQPSNQTITYCYLEGGKGFTQYTEYFETLWENKDLTEPLTEVTEVTTTRKKKRRT